jgi:hypothetical protein
MNRLDFNNIVAKRCELICRVLIEKGREYANDDEVFHNFKNAAGISFHGSHEKVAWEFMVKHLQSIKDIIEHVSIDGANGYPSNALIEEKIGDSINYLILIEGMLKERVQQFNKL